MVAFGLRVKLGIFPFFRWFIAILRKVDFGVLFILGAVQKFHLLYLIRRQLFGLREYVIGFSSATLIWGACYGLTRRRVWLTPNPANVKEGLAVVSIMDRAIVVLLLSQRVLLGV